MALQMDVTLTGGIVVTNAYHRVTQVNFIIESNIADIFVYVYKDKVTRDNGGKPCLYKSFNVPSAGFNSFLTSNDVNPLNVNHVSQVYEYLKTLPDYSGATDI